MFQANTPQAYIPLHPGKQYRDLTPREACERFDDFVATAPHRADALQSRLEVAGIVLDGSKESWSSAERWYRKKAKRLLDDRMGKRSRTLAHDFAALLGREVIRRHSGLTWELGSGTPISRGYNKPSIGKFVSRAGVDMQLRILVVVEGAAGAMVPGIDRRFPLVFNHALDFPAPLTDRYARIGDTWIHPIDRAHLRYDEVEDGDQLDGDV